MDRGLLPDIMCKLCNSRTELLLKAENSGIGPKLTFNVLKCTNCRSTLIDPIPLNLNSFYESYHSIPSKKGWERGVRSNRNRFKVIKSVSKEAKMILDFGSGLGTFVDAAKRNHYDIYAVEIDDTCRNQLESIIPGKIYKSISSFITENAKKPDVITLFHVFEHLTNPNQFLDEIQANFSAKTVLILEVPNADSFMFKIMGSNWPHLDVPRHIFLPTFKGIIEIARNNSMKVVRLHNSDNAKWGAYGISHLYKNNGEKRFFVICRRILQILLTPLFYLEFGNFKSTSTYLLTLDNDNLKG